MNLRETLTKEAVWNKMMADYPRACKVFCDWIDEYKREAGWDKLFNSGITYQPPGSAFKSTSAAPKFHDLPYAMQQGIWMEFIRVEATNHLRRIHPAELVNLEEDIIEVFSSLEPDLDDE